MPTFQRLRTICPRERTVTADFTTDSTMIEFIKHCIESFIRSAVLS